MVNTYKLKFKHGIDDLQSEYAFRGNSQGDESQSNEISDYKASQGWMSFIFEGIDINDQEAIYKEYARRKLANQKYIEQLHNEGRFGEEYEISVSFEDNPAFDAPIDTNETNFQPSSYKLIILDNEK